MCKSEALRLVAATQPPSATVAQNFILLYRGFSIRTG
jgi:hypothetical protein